MGTDRRGRLVRRFADRALMSAAEARAASGSPLAFVEMPHVRPNPNPRVPLAALVSFKVNRPVYTDLEVTDGKHRWRLTYGREADPQQGLPVVGMRPGREHTITVTVRDIAGQSCRAPQPLTFRTPPLPTEWGAFAPIQISTSETERMEPGVTLFSARRRLPAGSKRMPPEAQRAFNQNYALLVAVDAHGEVVWYYAGDSRISDFIQLRNGNLLFLTQDFCAVEIDLLGNVVASWYAARRPQGPKEGAIPIDAQTFHHCIRELSSGNLIVFTAQARKVPDFWTSEEDPTAPRRDTMVMGDEIVEFQRDGQVTWRWNAFDWLDPYRSGYETLSNYWAIRGFPGYADWTHGNGIWVDEEEDALIVSLRLQSAILKLDRRSGEIVWILGEPSDWPAYLQNRLLVAEEGTRWPYHQHAPSITPQGTLLLFDNGNYQAHPFRKPLPPAQTYSRAVEYAIRGKRVSEVWASDHPGPDAVVTYAMGDADWLPETGNVLVSYGLCPPTASLPQATWRNILTFPSWSRIREVTHTTPPQVVWELVVRDPSPDPLGWTIFGAERLPSLAGEIALDEP